MSLPEKILFVHSSLRRGGAERAMLSLAGYLTRKGMHVGIFLTDPGADGQTSYAVPGDVQLRMVSDSCRALSGVRGYCARIKQLRGVLKAEKPDLVIGMNSSAAVDLTVACVFLHTKKIACERANPYLSMKGTIWFYLKKWFSRCMDGYIFQTERASLFYPAAVRNKMAVIPNMVERVSANQYDLNCRTILSVGNLRKAKGHEILLRAFSTLEDTSWSLVICGEGEQRACLERQIEQLGLQGRVQLPGKVANVSAYYRNAGLFVLSSYHEGMPNALLEAMSYGLPCISTDCPMGPAELIQNGINGRLVPVGNAAGLALAMKELMENPSLRMFFSRQAFAVNETNSMEHIGAQWLTYLRHICEPEKK